MLVLVFALSAMVSIICFIMGIYEGVFQRKDGNFARALILHFVSLPFSVLTTAIAWSSGGVYGGAFQWGFVFFTFMNFILIIVNSWQAYLIFEQGKPNRNRRYARR
jgi:hypothetical protein